MKRYDLKVAGYLQPKMVEENDGDYITYKDAQDLMGELKCATHMAALWKRAAKKIQNTTWSLLDTENYSRAEKAEAAIAALEKDARELAELTMKDSGYIQRRSAARRIIEATKEQP